MILTASIQCDRFSDEKLFVCQKCWQCTQLKEIKFNCPKCNFSHDPINVWIRDVDCADIDHNDKCKNPRCWKYKLEKI